MADFQARAQQLEQTVAKAKGAAEALLARLNAPVPAPGVTPPPSMDNSTAVALAADYLNVTASGKSALGPMGRTSGVAKKFATEAPAAVVAAHNTIKAKTAEMTEMQKKAEEAKKTFEAANAALATHERSMKHGEAAKVNAAIFSRKDELAHAPVQGRGSRRGCGGARENHNRCSGPDRRSSQEAEKAPLQKKLAGAKDGIDALKRNTPTRSPRSRRFRRKSKPKRPAFCRCFHVSVFPALPPCVASGVPRNGEFGGRSSDLPCVIFRAPFRRRDERIPSHTPNSRLGRRSRSQSGADHLRR